MQYCVLYSFFFIPGLNFESTKSVAYLGKYDETDFYETNNSYQFGFDEFTLGPKSVQNVGPFSS